MRVYVYNRMARIRIMTPNNKDIRKATKEEIDEIRNKRIEDRAEIERLWKELIEKKSNIKNAESDALEYIRLTKELELLKELRETFEEFRATVESYKKHKEDMERIGNIIAITTVFTIVILFVTVFLI